MMMLLKAIRYVRQRTVKLTFRSPRPRLVAVIGGIAALVVTSCATTAANKSTPGLVTIQTAVTCPAPPVHGAVANPPRHFAAAPKLTLGHNVGYCAYVDTSGGIISIRLRPEHAPQAVADFIYLAQHGFYDGLTFYQLCPSTSGVTCPASAQIALAGDPFVSGSGGPGYSVTSDPVVGDYLFGAVAMFGSDPSKIGSQFFVSKGDSSGVPRKYDIFGQVTDGIPALAAVHKGTAIVWIAIEVTAPEP
jgi:cyclophilin family peptidyl-prolyl cis-trans isomerase